ncbi:glycosyltransferase [Pelagicoccus sp. SDUM812002]|uniref:glycosyltransferase n=1 Tax=Pelagicoccus sp. SDUM812002 TaxID=3041266 RepID=UPI00280EDD6C|nr:glycosyltransferase [Pelagicoccus sp. SDUM812002]MDQ8188178.1 glycosyltransferase [Pelagicoccus sp. SDUM812002]
MADQSKAFNVAQSPSAAEPELPHVESGSCNMVIVIATFGRDSLLSRTLESISTVRIPSILTRVIVAENGPEPVVREVAESFKGRIPIEYLYVPYCSKSAALNAALERLTDEFIVFFDDDVRLSEDTLLEYSKLAGRQRHGVFYGGRCEVDCPEPPPDWVKRYLPAPAKGWSLGDEERDLTTGGALGFNWAAYAQDIKGVGSFDLMCGPGTPANGDETNVENKLLESGVRGVYSPNAVVWHFVPPERCSADFAVVQKKRNEMGRGIALAERSFFRRAVQQVCTRVELMAYTLARGVVAFNKESRRYYHFNICAERLAAKLEGMRLGAERLSR